jgi:hypothetical protein
MICSEKGNNRKGVTPMPDTDSKSIGQIYYEHFNPTPPEKWQAGTHICTKDFWENTGKRAFKEYLNERMPQPGGK